MKRNSAKISLLMATLFGLSAATLNAGSRPTYPPIPKSSWETFVKRTSELQAHPPYLSQARLPEGYKIGRCLLEVNGKRYIFGKCAYLMSKGGDFQMDGPRQIYTGIDYPEPQIYADQISTDHFVQVGKAYENDGTTGKKWEAFGVAWTSERRMLIPIWAYSREMARAIPTR
jgi:hypothetical protein